MSRTWGAEFKDGEWGEMVDPLEGVAADKIDETLAERGYDPTPLLALGDTCGLAVVVFRRIPKQGRYPFLVRVEFVGQGFQIGAATFADLLDLLSGKIAPLVMCYLHSAEYNELSMPLPSVEERTAEGVPEQVEQS